MALFLLDRGEKWPTSTWTSVVQARPILPIQARSVWTNPGRSVDWHMGRALPARLLPRLKEKSDRRAASPMTQDGNHFNLHLHDKRWKGRKRKEVTNEETDKGKIKKVNECFLHDIVCCPFCLYSFLHDEMGEKKNRQMRG